MKNKYPDQCQCGGYFSHSSLCPHYQTPAEMHKQYLKTKAPSLEPIQLKGDYRILETWQTPNQKTDYQLQTSQWMTPIQK
jgi:hypothetical protein